MRLLLDDRNLRALRLLRRGQTPGDDAVGTDTLIALLRCGTEETEAGLGDLDVGVVVEVLQYEHQVALEHRISAREDPLPLRGDRMDDTAAIGAIGTSGEVTLVHERIDQSCHALLGDGEPER